jgi:hypothetical protein
MAVQVGELKWLMVDENNDAVFRAKKCGKAGLVHSELQVDVRNANELGLIGIKLAARKARFHCSG